MILISLSRIDGGGCSTCYAASSCKVRYRGSISRVLTIVTIREAEVAEGRKQCDGENGQTFKQAFCVSGVSRCRDVLNVYAYSNKILALGVAAELSDCSSQISSAFIGTATCELRSGALHKLDSGPTSQVRELRNRTRPHSGREQGCVSVLSAMRRATKRCTSRG